MYKTKRLHDILCYGDETLKIVEAFAEHDFCLLRLIAAFSAKEYKQLFGAICHAINCKRAFAHLYYGIINTTNSALE